MTSPWPPNDPYPPPPGPSGPPGGGYPPSPPPPWGGYPPGPPAGGWGYAPAGYPSPNPPATVQFPGTGPVESATISQRIIARCIDGAIFTVVIAVPVIAMLISLMSHADSYDTYESTQSSGADILVWLVVAPIVFVVMAVFYEWILIGLWGATFGKMAMHLRVVDQRTSYYIGLGPAFVRHLVILGPSLLPYVGVLASLVVLLSPLFDSSGRLQGWHDKAANDLVIKL